MDDPNDFQTMTEPEAPSAEGTTPTGAAPEADLGTGAAPDAESEPEPVAAPSEAPIADASVDSEPAEAPAAESEDAPAAAEAEAADALEPEPEDAPAEAAVPEPEAAADAPRPMSADEAAEEAFAQAMAGGGDEGDFMGFLLEQSEFSGALDRGDVVEGVVVRKDKHQLILDVGAKQEAVVPESDILRLPPGYLDDVQPGDKIKAVVLRPEGEVVVSLYQALTMADWDVAREYLDSGEIHELEVVGFNKGGIIVQLGNLQGFVPRSHMAESSGRRGEEDDTALLKAYIGRTIPVKVIEVSRRKRRLIMSERQAIREWRSSRKRDLLASLKEGDVRRGRVTSVSDFGAFVDLGGADGLVHVSEISHERGKHPKDLVKVGQDVDVCILSIDRERSRIGLSMKRLQADPWSRVEQDHYTGELVEASISNMTKFGAFARLEDGLEGLIHISELSDDHVEHPREVVRIGQHVTVEIISIDSRRHRLGLSIRRVPVQLRAPAPTPEELAAANEEYEESSDAELEAAVPESDAPEETAVESAPERERVNEVDAGAEADADAEAVADAAVEADAGQAETPAADAPAEADADDEAEANDGDAAEDAIEDAPAALDEAADEGEDTSAGEPPAAVDGGEAEDDGSSEPTAPDAPEE